MLGISFPAAWGAGLQFLHYIGVFLLYLQQRAIMNSAATFNACEICMQIINFCDKAFMAQYVTLLALIFRHTSTRPLVFASIYAVKKCINVFQLLISQQSTIGCEESLAMSN